MKANVLMKAIVLAALAVALGGCVDSEAYVRYKGSNLTPYQTCMNHCARAHADADNACSMNAWAGALGGSHTSGMEGMSCLDSSNASNEACEASCGPEN